MNRRTLLRILAAVVVAPVKLVMMATQWRSFKAGPLVDFDAALRSDFAAPPIWEVPGRQELYGVLEGDPYDYQRVGQVIYFPASHDVYGTEPIDDWVLADPENGVILFEQAVKRPRA